MLCYATTDFLEADFVAFAGGKGIYRQEPSADTVGKHCAVRQD